MTIIAYMIPDLCNIVISYLDSYQFISLLATFEIKYKASLPFTGKVEEAVALDSYIKSLQNGFSLSTSNEFIPNIIDGLIAIPFTVLKYFPTITIINNNEKCATTWIFDVQDFVAMNVWDVVNPCVEKLIFNINKIKNNLDSKLGLGATLKIFNISLGRNYWFAEQLDEIEEKDISTATNQIGNILGGMSDEATRAVDNLVHKIVSNLRTPGTIDFMSVIRSVSNDVRTSIDPQVMQEIIGNMKKNVIFPSS